MPSVKPSTFESRTGIKEEPIYYEPSWKTAAFEGFEGMTQQQFQDATSVYTKFGKLVPVHVPKGWRRVEGSTPGKLNYVHMETGALTHFPQEVYNGTKESWQNVDGTKITEADLLVNPYNRALRQAGSMAGAVPTVVKTVAPIERRVEKKADVSVEEEAAPVAAIEAAPEAAAAPVEEAAAAAAPAPEPVKPSEPSLPVCLMFPGQGSQYVKMMSAVKDMPKVKEMLDIAKEVLGYDLLEICLKGPEAKLEQTQYCQPAMFVAGLAGMEKLRADKPEKIDRCQALAGLSLGEYTALTVAGVFDFRTALTIVKLRGEAMDEASKASKQTMLSVAGLGEDVLKGLCKECITDDGDVCQIANFLFPNGFSCAGTEKAMERLRAKAEKSDGCLQAKVLKTSGGFHTPLMQSAKEKLLAALWAHEKDMKSPRCDVYMNLTGKRITPATKPAEIIPMLGDQLTNCVLWEPLVKAMIKDGVTEFYECGPMKQLKAMMKRIDATGAFKQTTTVDV